MKIVMVEWDDSYTELGWMSKDNYELLTVAHPVSIGILVKEDDECIVLVQSMSGDQYTGSIAIPKGCIKRMRMLKVKEVK